MRDRDDANSVTIWNEPYLESCCRSALHRLTLVGPPGRPDGLKDGPCLASPMASSRARQRQDGRWEMTEAGTARHAREVLRRGA